MIEFINKILNTDLTEVSADEKAAMFAEILNKLFTFVLEKLGL